MAKPAVAHTTDVEPIDRLEDKIRLLVDLVTRLRADQERAADENERLRREIDGLRARLSDADHVNAELTALRDERDAIRGRVAEMLAQLEAI
jgi:regulator of replication initiation timing